jgi:dsDNA-specific endonuclease/ATPase MutS2
MSSYDDKKKVFEDIKLLARPEQEELFRIIRRMKESYTENSNGIFFDLTLLSEPTFIQIKEYLKFCLRTRQEHECRLKELETLRIQNEQYSDVVEE